MTAAGRALSRSFRSGIATPHTAPTLLLDVLTDDRKGCPVSRNEGIPAVHGREDVNGFTYDRANETHPDTGYAVGSPDGAVIFDGDESLRSFLDSTDAPVIGGWVNRDRAVVLMPVDVIADREEAIRLGQERRQFSIFDLAAESEIILV